MQLEHKNSKETRHDIGIISHVVVIIICLILSVVTGRDTNTVVPGTIYAKSPNAYTHYKSSEISTEYRFAVRPDNESFKNYDVVVSFATYSAHEVGDHIAFNVRRCDVDPEYSVGKNNRCIVFLSCAVIMFLVCLLFTAKSDIEKEYCG